MHAKSLQSCLTPCDPMDGSPPDSIVHGILQARILEWVVISFCSRSHFVRTLHCDSSILGGPAGHGSLSYASPIAITNLWSMTGFLLLFHCKIWLQHRIQSTPRTVHVSQLSLYAPGTLNYLMFSANALSSLCSCIGVTLSACSDPATCSLDIFLLILQYLTGASALWGLLCLLSMQSELCFPCIIILRCCTKWRRLDP